MKAAGRIVSLIHLFAPLFSRRAPPHPTPVPVGNLFSPTARRRQYVRRCRSMRPRSIRLSFSRDSGSLCYPVASPLEAATSVRSLLPLLSALTRPRLPLLRVYIVNDRQRWGEFSDGVAATMIYRWNNNDNNSWK